MHKFRARACLMQILHIIDNMAELKLNGKTYSLPILEGGEKERAIDISSLRSQTGHITLDDGYGNTPPFGVRPGMK